MARNTYFDLRKGYVCHRNHCFNLANAHSVRWLGCSEISVSTYLFIHYTHTHTQAQTLTLSFTHIQTTYINRLAHVILRNLAPDVFSSSHTPNQPQGNHIYWPGYLLPHSSPALHPCTCRRNNSRTLAPLTYPTSLPIIIEPPTVCPSSSTANLIKNRNTVFHRISYI